MYSLNQVRGWYDIYTISTNRTITDVIKNPSSRKFAIENRIRGLMANDDGYCYKIISNNKMMFTCGYMSTDDKYRTIFHLYTPSYWDIKVVVENNQVVGFVEEN